MPENSVNSGSTIPKRGTPRDLLLHPGDQRFEKLTDPHVLGYVRRGVTELILQQGVCIGFLDQIDNAIGMPVL